MLSACGIDEQVDMCIKTLDGDKELKKEYLESVSLDGMALFVWFLKKAIGRLCLPSPVSG